MWVRGLKRNFKLRTCPANMSHPVWVRGLKRTCSCCNSILFSVAPRVGAWIETLILILGERLGEVAPRVGAWIETNIFELKSIREQKSHPVWVRGLKLVRRLYQRLGTGCRTPCGCVD